MTKGCVKGNIRGIRMCVLPVGEDGWPMGWFKVTADVRAVLRVLAPKEDISVSL